MKDLNGLTILGTEYSKLPFVFPRFDPDRPLRYIVFSAQGGGLAVEFFDQTGSENLDRRIEELRAVNQGIEIYRHHIPKTHQDEAKSRHMSALS